MDSLKKLREIRDELRRLEGLVVQRNRLIWRASAAGKSRRTVARAAGLSVSQVQRILERRSPEKR